MFCFGFFLLFIYRNSETAAVLRSENRRGSPEKEERSYTTRGSVSFGEENGKVNQPDVHGHGVSVGEENVNNNNHHRGGGGLIWPKLYIALSSKEKEEDFMAMKGCKLPQRPKKRAKVVQRTLLVSLFLLNLVSFKQFFAILLLLFLRCLEESIDGFSGFCLILAVGKPRGMVDRYVPREVRGQGEEDY